MLNELKEILYSVQLVRQLLGGSWYLVADYNRDKAVWSTEPPDGYHVLDTEEWVYDRKNRSRAEINTL